MQPSFSRQKGPATAVPLRAALRGMLLHPLGLTREWNWKAAAISAMLRGGMFFRVNLRAGRGGAIQAMLVESAYAIVAAGFAGAVTQRLRHAEPRRRTALVVWLAIPATMLALQAAIHYTTGTPRLRNSMIASFLFAAVATGFNWFAMSRGAFVTGEGRSFLRDLLLFPRLVLQFLLAVPKAALYRGRGAK